MSVREILRSNLAILYSLLVLAVSLFGLVPTANADGFSGQWSNDTTVTVTSVKTNVNDNAQNLTFVALPSNGGVPSTGRAEIDNTINDVFGGKNSYAEPAIGRIYFIANNYARSSNPRDVCAPLLEFNTGIYYQPNNKPDDTRGGGKVAAYGPYARIVGVIRKPENPQDPNSKLKCQILDTTIYDTANIHLGGVPYTVKLQDTRPPDPCTGKATWDPEASNKQLNCGGVAMLNRTGDKKATFFGAGEGSCADKIINVDKGKTTAIFYESFKNPKSGDCDYALKGLTVNLEESRLKPTDSNNFQWTDKTRIQALDTNKYYTRIQRGPHGDYYYAEPPTSGDKKGILACANFIKADPNQTPRTEGGQSVTDGVFHDLSKVNTSVVNGSGGTTINTCDASKQELKNIIIQAAANAKKDPVTLPCGGAGQTACPTQCAGIADIAALQQCLQTAKDYCQDPAHKDEDQCKQVEVLYPDTKDHEVTELACTQGEQCIWDVVNLAVNFLSAGVGLVVTIMIVIGGIQYTMSGDNPNATAAAKRRIFNAVFALIVFIFLWAFINWLLPEGII